MGVAAQDVLTLDSCLVLARANNVQFKTNRIEIEKSKLVKNITSMPPKILLSRKTNQSLLVSMPVNHPYHQLVSKLAKLKMLLFAQIV